ncbi:hypothetical protein L484_018914 [Morus notabilis]|uniref:Uncharacterized protein n=1 Tax=Morus notabilis TaxID=981085 RepID=W9R082_9ROSA|nr:hypothetical protein L484_018914 [Morus notabilis]
MVRHLRALWYVVGTREAQREFAHGLARLMGDSIVSRTQRGNQIHDPGGLVWDCKVRDELLGRHASGFRACWSGYSA